MDQACIKFRVKHGNTFSNVISVDREIVQPIKQPQNDTNLVAFVTEDNKMRYDWVWRIEPLTFIPGHDLWTKFIFFYTLHGSELRNATKAHFYPPRFKSLYFDNFFLTLWSLEG